MKTLFFALFLLTAAPQPPEPTATPAGYVPPATATAVIGTPLPTRTPAPTATATPYPTNQPTATATASPTWLPTPTGTLVPAAVVWAEPAAINPVPVPHGWQGIGGLVLSSLVLLGAAVWLLWTTVRQWALGLLPTPEAETEASASVLVFATDGAIPAEAVKAAKREQVNWIVLRIPLSGEVPQSELKEFVRDLSPHNLDLLATRMAHTRAALVRQVEFFQQEQERRMSNEE